MELIKLKDKVKYALEKSVKCRESDNYLLSAIWSAELNSLYKYASSTIFFAALMNGELSSAEGIRRARQKVQELFPELRGSNYRGRQKEQGYVKEQLIQMNLDKQGNGYTP